MKQLFAALAALALTAACSNAPETPEAATEFAAANDLTSAPEAEPEAESRPTEYALIGQKLPAFKAPMADGAAFDSATLNRWTVIAVWGAWCGDSRADGPYAEALLRAVAADPDLDFVTLHVPQNAERATPEDMFGKHGSLDAYFESVGYTLPVILDTDASLRNALKISWTPTYLVVSPDGIVRSFRTDLSVDKDQPVKTFIKDIARLRGEVRDAATLVISPAGAGGLGPDTPFTVAAVEKALPGHMVIPVTDPATGTVRFEVHAKGSQAARLIVEPDWSRGYVASVRSRDPAVRGPKGEVIGQARLGDLSEDNRALCSPSEPGWLVCPDPVSAGTFTRVYKVNGGDASDPAAILAELRYVAPAR